MAGQRVNSSPPVLALLKTYQGPTVHTRLCIHPPPCSASCSPPFLDGSCAQDEQGLGEVHNQAYELKDLTQLLSVL